MRLVDEQGIAQRATEDGRRTTPPSIELGHLIAASRAVETNTETAADLAYLRGRGTSLGGLRPKVFPTRMATRLPLLKRSAALRSCLGMSTTVEGVETLEQFDFSIAEGCDTIQEYHISHPLRADDLTALLLTPKVGRGLTVG